MRPIAFSDTRPEIVSSIAPPYSPRSGSMSRKPPPFTGPASIDRPTPVGGLRPSARSIGPSAPSRSGGVVSVVRSPIPSTTAFRGPSAALNVAAASRFSRSSPGRTAIVADWISSGPSCTWTGSDTSRAPLPPKYSPCALDRPTDSPTPNVSPSGGRTLARKPSSPGDGAMTIRPSRSSISANASSFPVASMRAPPRTAAPAASNRLAAGDPMMSNREPCVPWASRRTENCADAAPGEPGVPMRSTRSSGATSGRTTTAIPPARSNATSRTSVRVSLSSMSNEIASLAYGIAANPGRADAVAGTGAMARPASNSGVSMPPPMSGARSTQSCTGCGATGGAPAIASRTAGASGLILAGRPSATSSERTASSSGSWRRSGLPQAYASRNTAPGSSVTFRRSSHATLRRRWAGRAPAAGMTSSRRTPTTRSASPTTGMEPSR